MTTSRAIPEIILTTSKMEKAVGHMRVALTSLMESAAQQRHSSGEGVPI